MPMQGGKVMGLSGMSSSRKLLLLRKGVLYRCGMHDTPDVRHTEFRCGTAVKCALDDGKLIGSLSVALLTAFRTLNYRSNFIVVNSDIYTTDDCIDTVELRALLRSATHPDQKCWGLDVDWDSAAATICDDVLRRGAVDAHGPPRLPAADIPRKIFYSLLCRPAAFLIDARHRRAPYVPRKGYSEKQSYCETVEQPVSIAFGPGQLPLLCCQSRRVHTRRKCEACLEGVYPVVTRELPMDQCAALEAGLSHIRRGWHREWCTAFNTSFLTTGRFWAHTFGSDHGLLGLFPIHGDLPFGKIPCWYEWLETRDGGGFWAHTFGSHHGLLGLFPNHGNLPLGKYLAVALLFSTPLVMARPSPDSLVTLLVVPEFEGFEGINSILAIGTAAGGDVTTYELFRTGGTDPATETIIESSGGYTLIDAPVFTDHFNSVTTVLRTDVEGRGAEKPRARKPAAQAMEQEELLMQGLAEAEENEVLDDGTIEIDSDDEFQP
ncbi:hypothetical protein B0H10DRAFT_1972433 [Mycena sp. CBHHK59/15]|nr:hypothetical protein B0H10DRAFT_1972433 [Mycena sp. CBHHK59/15]